MVDSDHISGHHIGGPSYDQAQKFDQLLTAM